jgi:hypothetical protein
MRQSSHPLLRARGGIWHQKHREKEEIPHTSIDAEAHWTKSGRQRSRLWRETAFRFGRSMRIFMNTSKAGYKQRIS